MQFASGIKSWTAALLFAAALSLLPAPPGPASAADPGGKDDPLVTLSYVKTLSLFKRYKVPVGKTVSLASGAEIVLLDPPYEDAAVSAFDPTRSILVNLSSGERVSAMTIRPFQHYVNAGATDASLKFADEVTVLLRGEYK